MFLENKIKGYLFLEFTYVGYKHLVKKTLLILQGNHFSVFNDLVNTNLLLRDWPNGIKRLHLL